MRIDLNTRTAIHLDKDALIKLPRTRGTKIICTNGALWVTEDHMPQDIGLGVGECYISTGAGAVFVGALGPSSFRVVASERRNRWLANIAYQIGCAFRPIPTEPHRAQ